MSVNKVIILGRVGQDPQVRTVGDQKVANFSVATTEKYKDSKSGEWKENTEWHNIVCWRHTADLAEKYITKGKELYIEGKLRTRPWEDKDGSKKYVTEIVAESIQLLGKKEQSRDPYIAGAQQMQAQRPQTTPLPTVDQNENPTDDLPF